MFLRGFKFVRILKNGGILIVTFDVSNTGITGKEGLK